jgi:ribose transport system permease protein
MMNVARGLALVVSGGFPISGLPEGFRWLGAGRIGFIPSPVLVVVVLCAVLHLFLTRTTVGRDIYAIGGNKQAAVLCGIPVNSRLTLAYAISGAMAGLSAIVLAGRMNSGFPLAGMGAELDAIAAVIIGGASFFGGVGTVSGTLIGALMIGVVIVMAVWIDVVRQRAR